MKQYTVKNIDLSGGRVGFHLGGVKGCRLKALVRKIQAKKSGDFSPPFESVRKTNLSFPFFLFLRFLFLLLHL